MIYYFSLKSNRVSDLWTGIPGRWDVLHRLRGRMSITLYGSYKPDSEMRFLERQRDFLKSNGYIRAALVADAHVTGGAGPLEASKRHLANSDVNFFIFTRAGRRLGVTRELGYVADDPGMRNKATDCVVFDEVANGKTSIPPLSMCDIGNVRIDRLEFNDEDHLRYGLLTRAELYVVAKESQLAARLFTQDARGGAVPIKR